MKPSPPHRYHNSASGSHHSLASQRGEKLIQSTTSIAVGFWGLHGIDGAVGRVECASAWNIGRVGE